MKNWSLVYLEKHTEYISLLDGTKAQVLHDGARNGGNYGF